MHSKQQLFLKTSQHQIAKVIETLSQVAEKDIAEENGGGVSGEVL